WREIFPIRLSPISYSRNFNFAFFLLPSAAVYYFHICLVSLKVCVIYLYNFTYLNRMPFLPWLSLGTPPSLARFS
ncbi:hypothetical protein VIGAN_11128300, partial [Vigna angularis var. angularis]